MSQTIKTPTDTATEAEEFLHLDPADIIIGTNVRTDMRADHKEFRKSIKERGVPSARPWKPVEGPVQVEEPPPTRRPARPRPFETTTSDYGTEPRHGRRVELLGAHSAGTSGWLGVLPTSPCAFGTASLLRRVAKEESCTEPLFGALVDTDRPCGYLCRHRA